MQKAPTLVSTCIALVCTAASADASTDAIVLENAFVRRVLELDDGVWRTSRFTRADGTDALHVRSEEFLIRLPDGTELTARDYRCVNKPRFKTDRGMHVATVQYVPRRGLPKGAPTEVVVEYRLTDGPYLRKHILLVLPPDGAVDRLEVERLKVREPCAQGGRGEPVFVGRSWFVGLEYPGSEAKHADGLVTLAHFPGLAPKDANADGSVIESQTAVVGVGGPGDPIELAFSDYLETIRRPSRILLHYNSWYDFRENELTLDALVGTFEAFKKNVLDADARSFRLNFEIVVASYEPAACNQLATVFQNDLEKAAEVTADTLASYSLGRRLGQNFARLLSPIL